MKKVSIAIVCLMLSFTLQPQPLYAEFIPDAAAIMVKVQAQNTSGGTAEASWLFEPGTSIDGEQEWNLIDQPSELTCDQGCLGTITELMIAINSDPKVKLKFAVDSGSSDTTFTITAATVSFDPIVNPLAYAAASITATDINNNGATLTGLYNGTAYQARYNSPEVTWASLVGSFTAPAYGTTSVSDRQPPVAPNTTIINDTVSSIMSEFKFTLSAEDSTSGTSVFEIVPEPSTLTLLLLGCLGLLAFKRKLH